MKYSALVAAVVLLPLVNPASAGDPKIRVKLSEVALSAGDRAKVRVKATEDGYLLVLRMDTEGRVRVIFPVDPMDNAALRGRKEVEVRSRGDREAFTVAERAGSGLVLAVRADQPFDFAPFMTGERWNLSAMTPDSSTADPETALLHVADRVSGGHFDYDAVSYNVGTQPSRRMYASRYYDARFAGWYDPWYSGFYSPWPYYYGSRVGYGSYVRIGPSHSRWHGRR